LPGSHGMSFRQTEPLCRMDLDLAFVSPDGAKIERIIGFFRAAQARARMTPNPLAVGEMPFLSRHPTNTRCSWSLRAFQSGFALCTVYAGVAYYIAPIEDWLIFCPSSRWSGWRRFGCVVSALLQLLVVLVILGGANNRLPSPALVAVPILQRHDASPSGPLYRPGRCMRCTPLASLWLWRSNVVKWLK